MYRLQSNKKMKYLFLILFQIFNSIATSQILPKFNPNGIRRFSNGTNFTSLLLVDNAVYVGAK